MTPWFTWHWLWKSRARMLAVGFLVLAFSGAFLVGNELRDNPSRRSYIRQLMGGVGFAVIGSGIVLQGVLSGRDAFGDANDSTS